MKHHPDAVYRGAMLRVPKRFVHERKVRDDLDIANGAFWRAQNVGAKTEGVNQRLQLYRETDSGFLVPRHYSVPWKASWSETQAHESCDSWKCETPIVEGVTSKVVLRDDVQMASRLALQFPGDKILALGCGKGKTVLSIDTAILTRKLPVLVVVHTNALMDQWRDQIRKFVRVKYGRFLAPPIVGHVQQDVCVWEGCSFVVAMLHTFVKRKLPQAFFDYFRLVIFDELHRLGAEYFLPACSKIPAERWGLTATLKRDDGMDKAIQLHVGRVAYENLDQPLKPTVYMINTGLKVQERKFRMRGGRINLAKLTTHVSLIENRNANINGWINRAVNDGRTILVLGERIEQLRLLHALCETRSKSLHIGPMGKDERRVALKKKVVFATQHLAKEGLDRPAFDTLFILIPFSGEGRLRQSIGRILRLLEGKKEPKVLVFVDDIGIMRAMANKMQRHLRKFKFAIKQVKSSLPSASRAA